MRNALVLWGVAATLTSAAAAHANVIISSATTKNMNCAAGVCSPTAASAVLNTSDLAAMLGSSDVKVTSGSGAVTIGITSPLSWGSSKRLTLDAQHSVSIRSTVTVQGTGGLTITLDDGPSGALNFYPGGSIAFWDLSSSLIVNGNAYTLVGDIATLASDVQGNPSGRFALAGDYDATGDGTYADAPVKTPLAGTFEGLGHTVSHLAVAVGSTTNHDIGFFARVTGIVRDLSLASASLNCGTAGFESGLLTGENSGQLLNVSVAGSIICNQGDVGGLAGSNDQTGTITLASANVTVSGGPSVGGLLGGSGGTVSRSTASGTVNAVAGSQAGGLVGVDGGPITDSHAAVTVNAPTSGAAGGLVGFVDATIARCSASGNVLASTVAGGLVGDADVATIDSSFATGTATARRQAGGLIGYTNGPVTLTNSYATGEAIRTGGGVVNLGGLVGQFSGVSIASSWSSTRITQTRKTVIGGFVGSISNATVTAGYWDLDVSVPDPTRGAGNVANFPGITGLTTAQFQSGLPAGFDPAVWGRNAGINNGYPYLLANPPQ